MVVVVVVVAVVVVAVVVALYADGPGPGREQNLTLENTSESVMIRIVDCIYAVRMEVVLVVGGCCGGVCRRARPWSTTEPDLGEHQ